MARGRLISTQGAWLEAIVELDGQRLTVMDEFSFQPAEICPRDGDEIEFEFSTLLLESESWEAIFAGNPARNMGLEQIQGWRYRGMGRIVSIDPFVVDCGLLTVRDVVHTHDPRVIGEFVGFTISRLGVELRVGPP